MSASDYVQEYLRFWCWVEETFTTASVRNYLQSGQGPQSTRAGQAHSALLRELPRLVGITGRPLPHAFTYDGDTYQTASLWRVYHGKGAPNEIQDAIWLASKCGLLNAGTLATYADNNLGVDCGGFVANYWGIGRPDATNPSPDGSTGFKPRTIWERNRARQRASAATVAADDAAVFFRDVRNNDPDIAARQLADNSYDTASGSQAFHIGLVASVQRIGTTNRVNLVIAESSGAAATSGGNGVNVRPLGEVEMVVAGGKVYCQDGSGSNRIYFAGKDGPVRPYMANGYGA